eukprot:jgi/Mesen1/4927/ME000246S04149
MLSLLKACISACFEAKEQKDPEEAPSQNPPFIASEQRPHTAPQQGYGVPQQVQFPPLLHQTTVPEKAKPSGSWAQVAGNNVQTQHQQQTYFQVPQEQVEQYRKKPAHEQLYAPAASVSAAPSAQELQDLSQACHRLWSLDLNRLSPGQDYEIDCQGGKKVYQREDMAGNSLFTYVREEALARPTYARFLALLDNYKLAQGQAEQVTRQESEEQRAFIEEIARTAPIQYLHSYLASSGRGPQDMGEFKSVLHSLWFRLYGRGGGRGSSSAFEHVFVGEVKDTPEGREVSGFHNWVQFYLEESKGTVNYRGFILPRRRATELPDSQTQLLTVQFTWHGVLKEVTSSFIGVSPEFELALYTLCYYAGGEDNRVQMAQYEVNVKVYRLGQDKIGSAFPIVEE